MRRPCAQSWPKSQQHQHRAMRPQKRHQLAYQRPHGYARNIGRDEQQTTHRWRDHAQRQVVNHNHCKVNRVNAQLGGNWRKNGCQHHHARQGLNKNTKQKQKNVYKNQEHPGRQLHADDPVGHLLRQAFDCQHPGKGGRQADDDKHWCSEQCWARQNVGQGLPFQCSVNEFATNEGIKNSNNWESIA